MGYDPQNVDPTLALNESIPANAKSFIIVEGQEVPLPDAKVVTFRDDPSWDFLRHNSESTQYVVPRRVKGQAITTCEGLQDTVKAVILHSDITHDSAGCFRVLLQRGFSTHFMVDWNGVIYQSCDPVLLATHGGGSDVFQDANTYTVGIDVNCLQVNFFGASSPPGGSKGVRPVSPVIEINDVKWQSFGYTDAQYDALVKLLFALKSKFRNIQLAAPMGENGDVVWGVVEPDLEKVGLYGHMHLKATKFDPGPGFDWQRLQHGLSQEHNFFPVVLEYDKKTGRPININNVLVPTKVRELAEAYYRNTEGKELGGYYPVGRSGQWHGGVHLFLPKGADVVAMFPGRVVVARNGDETPSLGSNNFVLLKHEVKFDPNDDKRVFVFYSLYMHLQQFDGELDKTDEEWKAENPKSTDEDRWKVPPYWVRKLRGDKTTKEQEAKEAEVNADPDAPKPKAEPPKEGIDPETGKPYKKKDKKKKPDAAGAKPAGAKKGGEDEEESEDEDLDDEELKAKKAAEQTPFLDHGDHLAALLSGKVARFSDSANTLVQPGERIGRAGEFGDPDDRNTLVHVEVFADERWRKSVDLLGTHSAHWWEPDTDTDDDLTCDSAELLTMVLPEETSRSTKRYADFVTTGRRVHGDDVMAFYNEDPRANPAVDRIRRSVTKHVSEWSDQVDWFKSLASGQEWQERVDALNKLLLDDSTGTWRQSLFAAQIKRQLPFIWLTEDVAKHIGLEYGGKWDGVLYHFHPINFLLWLTLYTNSRVRTLSKGMSREKFLALKAKEEKEEAERRARGEFDSHGDEDQPTAVEDLPSPREVLKDLWEVPPQPDEWRRPSGPEE